MKATSQKRSPRNEKPKNMYDAFVLYEQFLEDSSPGVGQTQKFRECRSALFRFVLPTLGFERTGTGRMTAAEMVTAEEFMTTCGLHHLRKLEQLMTLEMDRQGVSRAVRNTYGSSLRRFYNFCSEQPWCRRGKARHPKLAAESSQPRPRRPCNKATDALMPGKGKRPQYGLKVEQLPPELAATLDDFIAFRSAPQYVDRVRSPIDRRTADRHVNVLLRLLGWWRRYYQRDIPPTALSLSLLVPIVGYETLEGLSPHQQKKHWREQGRHLKTWVAAYFDFLAMTMASHSDGTRSNILSVVLDVAYYQYRHQVEASAEYKTIPLINTIKDLKAEYNKRHFSAKQQGRFVVDQSKKWPTPQPGQTALSAMREALLPALIDRCLPRDSTTHFKKGYALATFLANLLLWSELLLEPPRRQEELRTRRLALACPIQRPDSVPADGLYHPLPPDSVRDHDEYGNICDNYLFFVYEHNGKRYDDGVWIKQIRRYKTHRTYGPQDIVIRNRPLAHGLNLYEYLERYLYGWWYSGHFVGAKTYGGWDSELTGDRGRWLSQGLSEFNPWTCLTSDATYGDWPWTRVLPVPRSGAEYTSGQLADHLAAVARPLLDGKQPTPHTLRYIWATWARQVGLSDVQFNSLAYAMGTSPETLQRTYERCTPEEKRRPIEEAIDSYFYDYLDQVEDADITPRVRQARLLLRQMNALERQQFRQLLDEPETS